MNRWDTNTYRPDPEEPPMTDKEAASLARLLALYMVDCRRIDPTTPGADRLTVLELVEDLAGSTAGPDQREIEEHLDTIVGQS